MNTTTQTAATGVLTASASYVGSWALFAPRSFYDDFPGFNRMWVGGDGPYNEHLVRDVGGLHVVHHGHHLGQLDALDAVGNVVTLGGTLVLALLLLVPSRKEAGR